MLQWSISSIVSKGKFNDLCSRGSGRKYKNAAKKIERMYWR